MQSIAVFPYCLLVLVATCGRLIIYVGLRAFENKWNAVLEKDYDYFLYIQFFSDNISTDFYCNFTGELQEGAIHLSHPDCLLPMPPDQINCICWDSSK